MLKHNLLLRVTETPCWPTAGSLSKAIKKKKLQGEWPVIQLRKRDSAINLKQILTIKMQKGLNGHTLAFSQGLYVTENHLTIFEYVKYALFYSLKGKHKQAF